jgi:hypothetical protein
LRFAAPEACSSQPRAQGSQTFVLHYSSPALWCIVCLFMIINFQDNYKKQIGLKLALEPVSHGTTLRNISKNVAHRTAELSWIPILKPVWCLFSFCKHFGNNHNMNALFTSTPGLVIVMHRLPRSNLAMSLHHFRPTMRMRMTTRMLTPRESDRRIQCRVSGVPMFFFRQCVKVTHCSLSSVCSQTCLLRPWPFDCRRCRGNSYIVGSQG